MSNILNNIIVHENDLPNDFEIPENATAVAIDTETTGLNLQRDRLCVVQLSFGDNMAHLIQIKPNYKNKSPNLRKKILANHSLTKIFHYARFDVAVLYKHYNILCKKIFCTKIAAYFAMTYTERHGLKEVCRQFAEVELNKQEQSSYWGAEILKPSQEKYAASDVLYLHSVMKSLTDVLKREKRYDLVKPCFDFIQHRAKLDVLGWESLDPFSHRPYA